MSAPTAAPPLHTVSQAARRLGVRPHRVYELIRENQIPGVVRLGRQVRIDPEALEEFIRNGGHAVSDVALEAGSRSIS